MTGEPAAVLHGPRDLRIEPVPAAAPREGEVRVAVRAVGLCGSDLHYYTDGRNGANVLRAPTVLGHEAAGEIVEVGAGVDPSRLGTRVAIEPARPCGRCPTCRDGRYNACPAGICLGSPPTHGTLRGSVVVPAEFAHPVPDALGDAEAALIEPLAVACWAVRRGRVGPGDDVLVTGAGPIGLLAVQTALAAGAASVTVTDVVPGRLAAARRLGATATIDPSAGELPDAAFDRLLECSGAPQALAAITVLRPGGVAAQVGIPAAEPVLPLGFVQRWEIDLVGCFRYGPGAFATAIAWAATGRVRLDELVTARFPLERATDALDTALTDRAQLKVIVTANGGDPA
ncbi:NAD(P)-dependent alcohol dehydrogenase [Actinomadura vinacea]|uniref:NAD(P)-dependent alcohol dehydrogenase n=1 Tax=Actinomadura vinacea TaxID=115336 RepID=A0ABN3J4F2_9ACTN